MHIEFGQCVQGNCIQPAPGRFDGRRHGEQVVVGDSGRVRHCGHGEGVVYGPEPERGDRSGQQRGPVLGFEVCGESCAESFEQDES